MKKELVSFITGFITGYLITQLNIKRKITNQTYLTILNSQDYQLIFQVLKRKPYLIKYLNQIIDNIYTYLAQYQIKEFELEIEKNLFEDELTVIIIINEYENIINRNNCIKFEEEFFYYYFSSIFDQTGLELSFRFEII